MPGPDPVVHPTATVHPQAQLESGVFVGPYCLVGGQVALGRNARLESHVVLEGLTEIGPDCRIGSHSVIGTDPQDVGDKGEETRVTLGAGNILREFVTIHRGTARGSGATRLGDRNYLMAFVHVGHDCRIGNETILTQGATLGGHVAVEDFANIGGLCGVHQFCRIGRYAFVGGATILTQDVAPFSRVAGSRPARFLGLNLVGLRRQGFDKDRLAALKALFNILFYSDLNTGQAVERIKAEFPSSEDAQELLAFVGSAKRGFIKKVSDPWDRESD